MSQTIQILVADDHPVVRDGLVAMLSTQVDFQVVGASSTGAETVNLAASLQPDVILLDLEMPEMDGVEALRRIRANKSDAKVIVFTAFDTDERILNAVRAGARGYLLKGSPREEIFKAIRVVNEGGSLLEPVVATKLMQQVAEAGKSDRDPGLPEPLTPREEEVLQLLAQGKTNKEIGSELVITERTVKFHVSSILRKMDRGNRTEAVRLAVELGLVKI
jgi:DNA-binding NarL/FixJ family response regulator